MWLNFNEISSICDHYGISNYSINSDGSIDVDGDVDLRGIRFWDVFKIRGKRNNWTLDRLPLSFRKVSGTFDCRYNNLEFLDGCPIEVGGDFFISDNRLKSLVGCPIMVRRFLAGDNLITDLVGCPEVINGDFNVSGNRNLVSLKGGPRLVLKNGYYDFKDTGLVDPIGFLEVDGFKSVIYFKNNPFCNLLNLFLSRGFGYNCHCVNLNSCSHVKDYNYIYLMIRIIIDRNIIDGYVINMDNFYDLYYDLLDIGVINSIGGELDLPGYILGS